MIEKSLDKNQHSVYIQSVLILIIHLIQSIQFWIDEKDKKNREKEERLKNKIFQSRDLCLRALDTNSACAKSVRRNEWKEQKNVRGQALEKSAEWSTI